MKHTCPKCGHTFEATGTMQRKGGKARWKGMSKAARSAHMRKLRMDAIKRKTAA